jgi:hypothetical protein
MRTPLMAQDRKLAHSKGVRNSAAYSRFTCREQVLMH